MIWEDEKFQKYVAHKFEEQYPHHNPYVPSEALARNYLFRACGIKLVSKLDDLENNETFKKIMKKFNEWSEK